MAYTLPAEWAKQSAIMLTWPHQETDWSPFLSDIESVYMQLAKHITEQQLLVLACHNESIKLHVNELLKNADINLEKVRWFIAPCNDTWARDHGPLTLTDEDGNTQLLDFTFNAWGAKYESNFDNDITSHLVQQDFCRPTLSSKHSLILEGGSIESDGNGTLLTTTKCLLNPNRNAHLSQHQIEQELKTALGMDKVIWLEHGHLAGDDTDAHVDTLARFAPEGIVYVQCTDKNDPHYIALNKMEQQLVKATDKDNTPYTLFPLPMPNAKVDDNGELLPATYANYLIINNAVLVPTYNDENDETALRIIGLAHPKRIIIGVDCSTVIKQFGSLHCLTMQIPADVIH